MSIQRYEPAAAACSAIRTRWARQTSASWSSPSWVGLTEISPVIPAADDLVDRLEVVGGDLLGRGQVLEVLAEPRVQRPDAGRLERQRGGQGILEGLARHEPADRPPHERQPWQTLLQPAVASGPQEDAAHRDLRGIGPGSGLPRMIGDHGARIAADDPLLRSR